MWAVIGGLVVLLLGITGIIHWWYYFVKGLMAVLPILGILGGAVAIASGMSDIKDRLAEKQEKAKEPEKKEESKEEEKKEEST